MLAAVAEVGTAMTVVGAVTGSKDLMKVGGIMGLVGGVGGLVAGAAGGAASAAGTADAATSDGIVSSAVDSSPSAAPTMAASDASAVNPTDMRLAAGTQVSPGATDVGMDPTAMAGSTTDPSALAGDTSSLNATGSTVDTSTSGAGNLLNGTDPGGGDAGTLGLTDSQPISSTPVASVTTPAGDVGTPAATSATPGTTPLSVPGAPTGSITNPTDYRLATGQQTSPLPSNAPMDTTSFLQRMMSFVQDPRNKTMVDIGSKAALGLVSGAEKESQFSRTLAFRQAQLAQTSYGSQVGQNRPHGIISGARA